MRIRLTVLFVIASVSSLLGQDVYTYQFITKDEEGNFIEPRVEILSDTGSYDIGPTLLKYGKSGFDTVYWSFESQERPISITLRGSNGLNPINTKQTHILYPDSIYTLTVKSYAVNIGTVEIQTSFTRTTGAAGVNRSSGYWLNHDQLSSRSANTLSESLDILPGVHSINTGVGISKPMIRGFVGNRVQVLQNGIAQEGQQWGMDHGLEIDQFAPDRVQIVNGPAALVRGAGLQTGAVEVYDDPPFRLNQGYFGDIQSLYKTNNQLYGMSGNLGYQSINEDYRKTIYDLRFSYQDFADYRVPANQFLYNGFQLDLPEGLLKNTAGQEWNSTLGFYSQLDDYRSLRLTYSHFDQKVGIFPGATGIPRSFDISNLGERRDIQTPSQSTTHDRLGMKYAANRGNTTWAYSLGVQYNLRRELSQPHAHGLTYIDSNDITALQLGLFTVDGKLDWTRKFYDSELKWGISTQYQNNERGGWEFILPGFDRFEAGTYAYYGWSTESWNLNVAGRLDGARASVSEYSQPWYAQPDSLVQRVPNFNRTFVMPSASFGWEWVNRSFVFSGHSGMVSRLPEVNELGSNGVHHGTFRHEIGNSELNPEYGVNLDLSGYYEFTGRQWAFKAKGTAYSLNYWNFIYLNPSGRFSPLPDAGQTYIYVQSPMLQWGGEAYLELRRFFKGTNTSQSLALFVMADIVNSQNANTGEYLPFQSPTTITGMLEYAYGRGKYGVEVQNALNQNNVARNEQSTMGYSLLNLYASYNYQFQNSESIVKFSLRLQNITNQSYLRHLSRYRILNLPEQGFNLILQAKYSF